MKTFAETSLSVLCADSSTLLGDGLAAVMETAGYSVHRARDGNGAWTQLSSNLSRYDVLFIDSEIPGLTALQLIGRARDAGFGGRIIVFARSLSDDDVELYWQMGVEAVVVKEVDAARLLDVVKAFHRQV